MHIEVESSSTYSTELVMVVADQEWFCSGPGTAGVRRGRAQVVRNYTCWPRRLVLVRAVCRAEHGAVTKEDDPLG